MDDSERHPQKEPAILDSNQWNDAHSGIEFVDPKLLLDHPKQKLLFNDPNESEIEQLAQQIQQNGHKNFSQIFDDQTILSGRLLVKATVRAELDTCPVLVRSGGFTIRPSDTIPIPANARLRVSVAYDIPSGNPLKAWTKFDFEFSNKNGKIKCKGSKVRAKMVSGRELELHSINSDFSFSAEGFDENRDLFIRIDEIDEETDDMSVETNGAVHD